MQICDFDMVRVVGFAVDELPLIAVEIGDGPF